MNAVKFASCHLHANDKCSTQKMPLRINLLGAELVSRRVDDYDANDIYSFFFSQCDQDPKLCAKISLNEKWEGTKNGEASIISVRLSAPLLGNHER